MKRYIGLLALAFGLTLSASMIASPASATQAEHNAANAWNAHADASIVDATTVELRGADTSVETTDLDFPVQAQHKIKFTYELLDDAVCAAGAPRVFVEIDGVYVNSWDGNAGQCGIDNGDGTSTVEFSTGANGRIGAMGVVFDQSGGYVAGSAVRVSNVTVDKTLILFTVRSIPESPEPTSSPTPEPSASPSVPATESPAPVIPASNVDQLPLTGSSLPMLIVGGGLALIGVGAGATFAARKRTPKFTE